MHIDYSYMRKSKADFLQNMHNSNFRCNNNLEVKSYCNAKILPAKPSPEMPFGLGGVVNERNEFILDSGIDYRFGGFYESGKCEFSDERVVYCGYFVKHWGHFLIEGVARLWYFLENKDVDKFIFSGNLGEEAILRGNYKEFLDLLGITDKVEIINKPISFREIIVPQLGYKREGYYSNQYINIFRVVSQSALDRTKMNLMPAKVFLSRRKFAEKSEIGLDMLDDFFTANGYEILYPEELSLTMMINYLHFAEECAAESGTLAHNFLFAQSGKKVVILERQDILNEAQADIDRMQQLTAVYVDCYYTIYPGGKPYYIAFNECARKYASEKKMDFPDKYYLSEKYKRKAIAKYMKLYRKEHGWGWDIPRWTLQWANVYYDSYIDTLNDIGDYIHEKKIFSIKQICSVKHWKIRIRNMISK